VLKLLLFEADKYNELLRKCIYRSKNSI